ncbi:MAG: Rrf2 family transcriptional regulator [candidate division Zixibacteria bacterium]|nr:Rrf2 family transcriptional regulator [candidate division Zixibacteria bacterium]
MKFSTRARYGLRMMVELARELQHTDLVHLGRIAKITGLSENYLAQLAMSLKNSGLVIGVSGKKGGYQLAKPPDQINIGEIVEAVIGPIALTECVSHPDICLNAGFCETRMVWAYVNTRVLEALNEFTLADLIRRDWLEEMHRKHPDMPLLSPNHLMLGDSENRAPGCP